MTAGWCVGSLVGALLAVVASTSTPVYAAPLTLEAALTYAEAMHPDLAQAQAQSDLARAETELSQSQDDFRLTLEASLRSGRNAVYDDHFRPDHQVRLNARKTLLDAGRQQAATLASEQELAARAQQLLDVRAQRRISLMTRFFDVLLADMQDAADTEALATAYVSWDNSKDRQALGQMAQWELAELEARYLEVLTRRNDVRRGLREKRMALGAAMNLPGMMVDDLVDPKLAGNERPLPEFDDLLARVLAGNPRLAAQKQLLAAASQRLNGVRAEYLPSLEFEAEAAYWQRETSTRDDLRAGINLVWPLWQGGRADARIGREQARFQELQAQHDKLLQNLRQSLIEVREEIAYLRQTARRSAEINTAYRDQALDKARAEYELELKTNLGSSMAETQYARMKRRAIEYRLALAWARLDALLGESVQAAQLQPGGKP